MSDLPQTRVRRFSRSKVAEEEPPVILEQEEEAVPDEVEIEEDDFLADLKTGGQDPVEELLPPPPPASKKRGGRKKKEVPVAAAADDDFADLRSGYTEPPPTPEDPNPYSDAGLENHPVLSALKKGGRPGGGGNKKKKADGGGFDDLFGSSPTPILGSNKRQLLTRISQYKSLFQDIPAVKAFKVKANASDQELETAIGELDSIVSCGTLQSMVDNMILSAVQTVEVVSSRTNNFDITGTADLLRQNQDFYRLAKILTIKHGVFAQVPPEYQMLLLIFSTAMIARQKNVRAAEINGILHQQL